jgi:hypothetical protein
MDTSSATVAKLPLHRVSTRYRSELSASGNRPDELKSGLQKYCRRGEEDKAMRCASELYCFGLVEGGKALYTNLVHRLMIVYLEDVGPSCFLLWELLDLLLETLQQRDVEEGSRVELERRDALCWWVSALCGSDHSRALSHLGAVFRSSGAEVSALLSRGGYEVVAEARKEAITRGKVVGETPYPRFQDSYIRDETPLVTEEKKETLIPADDANVRRETCCMLSLLHEASDGALYWAYKLLNRTVVGRRRSGKGWSTKPAFLVLDALEWYALESGSACRNILERKEELEGLLDRARRWYRELSNLKEGTLCVTICLQWLLLATRGLLDEEGDPPVTMDTAVEVFELVGEPLVFDEYVLDMHTRAGRSAGKGRTTFANEGALVVKEDARVTREEYKRFYEDLKREDDAKKPKDARARKGKSLCSSSRPPPLLPSTAPTPAEAALALPALALAEVRVASAPAPHIRESEWFAFLVRAQVTCSDARPDTYFARERVSGRRVFVKGPYKDAQDASVPARIHRFKLLCMPELPAIPLELKLLVPDLFPDVPLGVRRHVDRAKPQWFLVSESLLARETGALLALSPGSYIEGIPVKEHETKVWGKTRVVDWDLLPGGSAFVPDTVKLKGAEMTSYVLAVLFRYVVGIPDPADRNFLIVLGVGGAPSRIYSTDEEGVGRETSYWNGLKKRKCERIRQHVGENWKELGPVLKAWLERVRESVERVKTLLGMKDVAWLVGRLEGLQSAAGVARVFSEPA